MLFRNRFLHLPRLILLLSLFGQAGLACAQYESVPASQLYQSEQDRYAHLKYFGFYASAMESWNFTEELSGFTNLTWIHVGTSTDQASAIAEILQRLGQAESAGVQAVVSLEPFLFANKKGEPRPEQEIEDFLVELRARLESAGLVDTLAMLYPKDEPFREFIQYRKPNFYEQYVTGDVYKDIHRDLTRVNALIKLAFPDKPIGVILSGYELFHKFFSVPENYDWVGFDCYANLFRACDDKSFVQTYRHLLDHMQPHQQLMAVPETWATNEYLYRLDWPTILHSRLLHHYEIALNEPRFVAFIPFLWSFDADQETPGLGLNRFGELYDLGLDDAGTAFVDLVKDIGLQIKDGTQQFPNLAWAETENNRYRAASVVRGEIMGISQSGVISAWAIDEALPHKNLRLRVLVVNSDGKVVHKSRMLRTNVDDAALRQANYFGKAFVGVHGFRYELPADLWRDNALNQEQANSGASNLHGLRVELRIYGDGLGADGMGAEQLQAYSMPLPDRHQLLALQDDPEMPLNDGPLQTGLSVRQADYLLTPLASKASISPVNQAPGRVAD